MAGNVFEWGADWAEFYYYDTYDPDSWADNPTGPTIGTIKVMQGGVFYCDWEIVRSNLRSPSSLTMLPICTVSVLPACLD